MTPLARRVDLHLHTSASDGMNAPEAVARAAKAAGMDLIAITDHDGTGGVRAAQAEGARLGLSVISGIELSCGQGEEIHLLGYGIRPEDATLAAFLDEQLRKRQARMLAMLERLRTLGMPVEPDEVRSEGTAFMGRMRLAQAMVSRGYACSVADAFARYLSPGKAAYVPRERVRTGEGIALLSGCGAVVSLAHPGRLEMDLRTLEALLPEWKAAGLAALEAYHSSHGQAMCAQYDRMARRHGLLITGGSDSHGRPEGPHIGQHVSMWTTIRADTDALLQQIQSKQNRSEV